MKPVLWAGVGVMLLLIAAVVTAAVQYSRYEERAAKFDLTKIDEVAERSAIYDHHGEFYSFFGGENRLVVPLANVSKHFLDALLAREDSRFWEHQGVDFRGVVRAFVTNVRAGDTKQGASTITQQLARNACGLRERSLDRKALEAVLARRIEVNYSKEQILELYVNRIYFGSGYYGIETASRGYFGKSAAKLSLGEGAALAALIRSPNKLAPSRDVDAATAERNVVLDRMAELGMVTREELAAARAQQLHLAQRNSLRVTDDAVTDAVLRELNTLLAPETLDHGGLKVKMTIDPQLQRLAEAAADRRLTEIEEQKKFPHPKKADFVPEVEGNQEKPTNYLQAAVVLVDNSTGAVRAAVSGRDYRHSKYSRALVSKRQIGSTFKPFVYAAAFEKGMLPGTVVDDSKIVAGEFRDLPKNWSPENSDGEYGGLQPASLGLLKSRNTMSVRVGEFASLPKVRELAQATGLSGDMPDLPVVFLGGFETTVRDLAAAYTIFPNLGVYRAPHLITSVEDREGTVLWKAPDTEKKVLEPDTAWMVSGILQQAMKSGTAAKAASMGWKKNGAGKTGTTNDFFDAWFVGYTTSLTCAVWVGMDQPETIMEKGYGGTLALPIWVDIMKEVPEQKYPAAPFPTSSPTVKVALCSTSGARATSTCVAQRCAYQMDIPNSRLPRQTCPTHPEPPPMPVATAPTYPGVAYPPATANGVASVSGAPAAMPVSAGQRPVSGLKAPESTIPPGAAQPPVAYGSEPRAGAVPAETVLPSQMPPRYAPQQIIRPGRQYDAIPRQEPVARVSTAPAPAPQNVRVLPERRPAFPATAARVEVRRAVPVTPSSARSKAAEPHPADVIAERKVVERAPDGRLRTTTIRTVRVPKGQGAPPVRARSVDDDD